MLSVVASASLGLPTQQKIEHQFQQNSLTIPASHVATCSIGVAWSSYATKTSTSSNKTRQWLHLSMAGSSFSMTGCSISPVSPGPHLHASQLLRAPVVGSEVVGRIFSMTGCNTGDGPPSEGTMGICERSMGRGPQRRKERAPLDK